MHGAQRSLTPHPIKHSHLSTPTEFNPSTIDKVVIRCSLQVDFRHHPSRHALPPPIMAIIRCTPSTPPAPPQLQHEIENTKTAKKKGFCRSFPNRRITHIFLRVQMALTQTRLFESSHRCIVRTLPSWCSQSRVAAVGAPVESTACTE